MAAVKTGAIIGVVISLILIAALLPIGIADLVDYNGSYTYANGTIAGYNTTMETLVGTVIPIIGVIGIAMMFIARKSE